MMDYREDAAPRSPSPGAGTGGTLSRSAEPGKPGLSLSVAVLALTAGIVWDKNGPHYVFTAFVGIDLLIRVPLLISIPETWHVHLR